ncbi:MAG TPA: hypothetical protein VLG92_02755 [Candidatus Saccharimonadia bacterium]|nr:hypothetical protein [Candidatus Saccharimonadia bacterium]
MARQWVKRQALKSTVGLFISTIFSVMLLLVTVPALAINYGSGTYGSCQFGSCSITIGSSGTVNVDVIPTGSGSCTIQKDAVTVTTSNTSGYTLSLADTSTNTALLKGASTIAASSASQASPAPLAINHWGYRVDGVGGFGAGPTSAQTNTGVGTTTFAGIPASNGTPSTLASTSTAASSGSTTNVWYGVCANVSIVSGSYTSQVLYTAVTN